MEPSTMLLVFGESAAERAAAPIRACPLEAVESVEESEPPGSTRAAVATRRARSHGESR